MKTIIAFIITAACSQALAADPLPSWNDTATKEAMDLPVNDDGSIDLYFCPTPPPQGEKSWVKTKPGEGFFMYFRFYGPLEPFYDKSWRPADVVKVK